MPAQPQLFLHANRPFSCPSTNGTAIGKCISRSNILNGTVPCAFGQDQNMEIVANGIDPKNPSDRPQDWLPAGSFLRVPKCVILSTVPFWTLWWPNCYFLGPRDVIGEMQTPPYLFGNYYYFDQWNNVDTEPDPTQRYDRIVGSMNPNPWYQMHQTIWDLFVAVKDKLAIPATGQDPIYCIMAEWMPRDLNELNNNYLTQTQESLNPAHGGAINGQACEVTSAPCYNEVEVSWGPSYPDPNGNPEAFIAGGAPWLASTNPGFGTDVLHIYVGHPVMKYFPSSMIWDWQAWPSTPEATWFGPIFFSNYLGNATLPYYTGRRTVWEDAGLDYGYTGTVTPFSLYENIYSGIIADAAEIYQTQFWNFRNLGTRLFIYPINDMSDVPLSWDLGAIWQDRENTCPGTQFFFGYENFSDFATVFLALAPEDNELSDCEMDPSNPAHLKFGETNNFFPAYEDMVLAVNTFYPPIVRRVENYYTNIEPGAMEFFQIAYSQAGLYGLHASDGGYNVSLGDSSGDPYAASADGLWPSLDSDVIVKYILDYFYPKH